MSGNRPPDSSQSSLWAKAGISPTELHTKLLIYRLGAGENLVVLNTKDDKDQGAQKALPLVSEKTAEWLEKIDPHVYDEQGNFIPPDLIPVERPVSPVEFLSQAPDRNDREHEWDNHSTLDEPIWEDLPASNQTDRGSTITAETLALETFLDRVAEFVSPGHGADHVTSAAIAGLRTERPRLALSKNSAFSEESQAFLITDFAESLRQVAEAKAQSQVRALKRNRRSLYDIMCRYAHARVRYYAAEFCRNWSLHDDSPSRVGEKVTKILREFCQKCQPDHLTTPDLVMAAYELTLNVLIKGLMSMENTHHIDQVLRNLWFCARTRRAFVAFQELCYAVPELRNLVIECLEHVEPDLETPGFWTLDQCKTFLGQHSEAKQFKGLKKGLKVAPKLKLRAHCEIRLAFATGMPRSEFFNYIGGSKRPCWLCHLWLNTMGIRSKETHAQLYGLWTFPSLPNCGPYQEAAGLERLVSATQTTLGTILGFLDSVIPRLTEINSVWPKIPHSSLGDTRQGLNQKRRLTRLYEETVYHWLKALAYNQNLHEAFHECCKTNLRKPAHCQSGCGKLTSRECSSCGEGYFCSEDHEEVHERPHGRFNRYHVVDCVPKLDWFKSETERNVSSQLTSCFVCDASKAYPCRGCFSIFFCSPECYFEDPRFHVNSCEIYSRARYLHDSGPVTEVCLITIVDDDDEGFRLEWIKTPEIRTTSIREWLTNLPTSQSCCWCRVRRIVTDESIQDRFLLILRNADDVVFTILNHYPHTPNKPIDFIQISQLGEWQVLNLGIQDWASVWGRSPWDNCGEAGTGGRIIPGTSILRSVKVNSPLDVPRAGGIIFANETTYCNGKRKRRFSNGPRSQQSQIAGKIGYPIVVWMPPQISGVDEASGDANFSDLYLESLLLDTDPSSPTWGQSTLRDSLWSNQLSSSFWVFAEDDSFSINARLVEHICFFCMEIRSLIAEGSLSKNEVNEELTRTKFDEFVVAYEGVKLMEIPTFSEPTLDDSAHAEPDGVATAEKAVCDAAARLVEERISRTHWLTDKEAE